MWKSKIFTILKSNTFTKHILRLKLLFIVLSQSCLLFPQNIDNQVAFDVNGKTQTSLHHDDRVKVEILDSTEGIKKLIIVNISNDTISISNVLYGDVLNATAWITGLGDHTLSRSHLFIPGKTPVNVILPDNAWELGYTSYQNGLFGSYALCRRKTWHNAYRKRFETILYPQGKVNYEIRTHTFKGEWQNGLRICFQSHKLYDLSSFDEAMYQRKDLQWIQGAYMMHLIMAWDKRIYDYKQGKYQLETFLKKGKQMYGGDDVIGLWPTWPTLGLDQRNQWDMYRDLPGSLKGLKELSDLCHQYNTRLFIAYNPWDESTRPQEHLDGMAELVKQIGADGVILDTRGNASKEMQDAVDRVRPGVMMYSEGMAVPKDMESILSGRVHNALYYPPILNLNKLIKPEFGIFRVAELYKEPVRREIHSSFFNGYGIEFNIFHPGDPDWADEQYKYLGKVLFSLRQNNLTFLDKNWVPLYPGLQDSILINHWHGKGVKELFTVYSFRPSGFNGELLKVDTSSESHWIDLWHHKELDVRDGYLSATIDPYPIKDHGTNNEGTISLIARLPRLIKWKVFDLDSVVFHADKGTHFLLYNGIPEYDKTPKQLNVLYNRVKLHSLFPDHDGDFILQLMDSTELIDEIIIRKPPSTPYKLSAAVPTSKSLSVPAGMIAISSGAFKWNTKQGDEFIPYPANGKGETIEIAAFYIDAHPVTNKQYHQFIKATGYKPKDKTNFLKHWENGNPKKEDLLKPVVYVSDLDAQAYCLWANKRLPTEVEWQYAAQSEKLNTWPWGNEAGIKNSKAEIITETLTHQIYESFDSTRANPGNGFLDEVNHYPLGKTETGITDLVGSVWQMTSDVYRSGSYEYRILKGGSYYKPLSSWWYVQGGPKPLEWRQMWLKVSQGFERSSTVGFRCVRD
jgi:iron(II)-dependent oxidoreductase